MVGATAIITGLITNGFTFIKQWWTGKQEQSMSELKLRQETARVKAQIKLQQVTGQLEIDSARVKAMSKTWVDEFWQGLFALPLVSMFISPFVDLYVTGVYTQGMLAKASEEALNNLGNAPVWYIIIIITMVFLSLGYEKGIEKVINIMNWKK